MMEALDLLEEKINKLVATIKRLRDQSQDTTSLKEENERLKEQIRVVKERIEGLVSRLDSINE